MPPTVHRHATADDFLAAAGEFLAAREAEHTSNKIYQAIGYEPVCDVDQVRFWPDA